MVLTIPSDDRDRYHVLTKGTILVLSSPWWWRYKRFCLPVGRHLLERSHRLAVHSKYSYTALTKDPQKILIDHTVVITVVH